MWIWKISSLPFSSGKFTSTCTSSRPDRSKASSIKSFRFVIPIISTFFGESTPSMRVKSWLTKESPMLESLLPLCRAIASNSSKIITWRPLLSPFSRYSRIASSKRALSFLYPSPTNLSISSGPLTIFGSTSKILDISRAIKVFPVPGGP